MTPRLRLARWLKVPDLLKVERFSRTPDLGPKLLFFSGGSALREASRYLIGYTHNSIHLITPFDSGGSSAHLRKAFGMLAVGDLRNRLIALADRSLHGHPEVYALFTHRFPTDGNQAELEAELEAMVEGSHPLVTSVPDPMRKLIRSHLRFFNEARPPEFDLRQASIGNLVLAGGYLTFDRHIDPVLFLFCQLVEARGVVRPVISADLHLAAECDDGRLLVGQHQITREPFAAPPRRLFIADAEGNPSPIELRDKVRSQILSADLITFPIGSFFTSLLACLLPAGVGQAVSQASAPKVFIPNPGPDPEAPGLSVKDRVTFLVDTLRSDNQYELQAGDLLDVVVLDQSLAAEAEEIARLGISPLVVDLGLENGRISPERLTHVLLSLC